LQAGGQGFKSPHVHQPLRIRELSKQQHFRVGVCAAVSFAAVFLVAPFPSFGLAQAHQLRTPSHQGQPQSDPGSELQAGTDLTQHGRFAEAIPHLLAARGHVANEYAASFNLALCYVATSQPKLAIPVLEQLQREKSATAAVWNLSAQAYVGDAQPDKAFSAVQRAAEITPDDARLYSYVSDACMAASNNDLGLKVVDLGLHNVPRSARLHYERAVFLTNLDRFDEAKKDFQLARELGTNADIGYLAAVHESLIQGNLDTSIRVARQAISEGKDNYILLSLYADALFRAGAYAGSSNFSEAERAAEKSVAQKTDYAPSRITLAKLYRIGGRLDDSISQLEAARKLDPHNPAVYSNLATAYRLKGDRANAHKALAVLESLNRKQVIAIRDSGTNTGDRRGNVSAVRN
jgi:predicted Zn-dependent protease